MPQPSAVGIASPTVFEADLNRLNDAFKAMGALIIDDGEIVGIDPKIAPAAMLRTYSQLLQYGYANGLI